MILCDTSIDMAVSQGLIDIDPFDPACVQPSSYDIHISGQLRWASQHNLLLDIDDPESIIWESHTIAPDESFLLHPGKLILAGTLERVRVPSSIAASVMGVSSLGRLGLTVYAGAPWIDPGFDGQLTLELGATSQIPVALHAGMRIGQLIFYQLNAKAQHEYSERGRYQHQEGPTPTRVARKLADIHRGLPSDANAYQMTSEERESKRIRRYA